MIYIESNKDNDRKINLTEIAEGIGSPVAFTAKILQKLRKSKLLLSTIGAKGGFQIPDGKKISLVDIVMAIDGDTLFTKCVLGLASCSCDNPCPIHEKYIQVKEEAIMTMLDSSLADLLDKLNDKRIILK